VVKAGGMLRRLLLRLSSQTAAGHELDLGQLIDRLQLGDEGARALALQLLHGLSIVSSHSIVLSWMWLRLRLWVLLALVCHDR